MPPLVEIGLTDLPKTGGQVPPHPTPASPLATGNQDLISLSLATSLFDFIVRFHEIFLRQSFFFKLVPCFEKESSISNMLARKHDRKPEEISKFISSQEFTCTLILSMYLRIMAVRVVEFSNGGYKIRKIFAQESTYLPKL